MQYILIMFPLPHLLPDPPLLLNFPLAQLHAFFLSEKETNKTELKKTQKQKKNDENTQLHTHIYHKT